MYTLNKIYKNLLEQVDKIDRFKSSNFKMKSNGSANVNDFKSSPPLFNKLGFKKDFSIYLNKIDDRRGWLFYVAESLKDYSNKNKYIGWAQGQDPFGRFKIIFYVKK